MWGFLSGHLGSLGSRCEHGGERTEFYGRYNLWREEGCGALSRGEGREGRKEDGGSGASGRGAGPGQSGSQQAIPVRRFSAGEPRTGQNGQAPAPRS